MTKDKCLQFHITGDDMWVANATPETPAKKVHDVEYPLSPPSKYAQKSHQE
jgi:hypothetical protein